MSLSPFALVERLGHEEVDGFTLRVQMGYPSTGRAVESSHSEPGGPFLE